MKRVLDNSFASQDCQVRCGDGRACRGRTGKPRARVVCWLMLLAILCGGPFGRITIAAEVLETESSQPAEEKDPTVTESETLVAGRRTGWRLRHAAAVRCALRSPTARLEGAGRVGSRRTGSQISVGLRVPLRC